MKTIELTRGKVAIVDDSDYVWLSQYNWYAYACGDHWVAARNQSLPKGSARVQQIITMHREILGLKKGDGKVCDHKDHDPLIIQRINLRVCTTKDNVRNRRSARNSSSKYLGVARSQSKKSPWQAQIRVDGKLIYLGSFVSEDEAAKVYDKKALELFGEFANPNFK